MSNPQQPRIVFIANCVYTSLLAGGDIHFFNMAHAAVEAGYRLLFFGGHSLENHLERWKAEYGMRNEADRITQAITDESVIGHVGASLRDQFRLLLDYWRRFRGTMRQLDEIREGDIVYAVTDYWFDAWPALRSRAHRKLMILGMDAPTLPQIIRRARPDVTATRLNSIYYWLSQNISLRLFRRCRTKRLFYVHPSMKQRLLRMGYQEHELVFISNGFDLETAEKIPAQQKNYDLVWIGRMHRQKGIDDLLDTLVYFKASLPTFRAVLIGKLEAELKPEIVVRGLAQNVEFAGLVSEEEKFRLFKASRIFLMPSKYESWGIVIGEALICGLPVIAYDLDAYRPIFGDLVRYVPRFDLEEFKREALKTLIEARAGKIQIPERELEKLKAEHSWQAARERFKKTLAQI